MNPRTIASRLIGLASEAAPREIDGEWLGMAEMDDELLAQEFGVTQRYLVPAKQMLDELQGALADGGWDREIPCVRESDRDRWTFGTAMIIRGTPRAILRGFLQPLRRVPILTRVPDRVALYLMTIDEGEDYLEKETHSGVGWHYHYLDWRRARSDVVLCWDTRWIIPNPQTKPPAQRGLFVEKHAEGGKPFKAKPRLWGPRKRKTMYDVCDADLQKRRIEEYRCAANKSELVYPPGTMLTPHPLSVASSSFKVTTRGRKGKKGRR